MAVPKKKTSVSRKGLRRAGQTHKLYRTHAMSCPNCKDLTLPNHACPSCGMYKGKQVFEIKVKADADSEGASE